LYNHLRNPKKTYSSIIPKNELLEEGGCLILKKGEGNREEFVEYRKWCIPFCDIFKKISTKYPVIISVFDFYHIK